MRTRFLVAQARRSAKADRYARSRKRDRYAKPSSQGGNPRALWPVSGRVYVAMRRYAGPLTSGAEG
jgi:hypothetical protein